MRIVATSVLLPSAVHQPWITANQKDPLPPPPMSGHRPRNSQSSADDDNAAAPPASASTTPALHSHGSVKRLVAGNGVAGSGPQPTPSGGASWAVFAQPPLSSRTASKPLDFEEEPDDDMDGDGANGPHWSDAPALPMSSPPQLPSGQSGTFGSCVCVERVRRGKRAVTPARVVTATIVWQELRVSCGLVSCGLASCGSWCRWSFAARRLSGQAVSTTPLPGPQPAAAPSPQVAVDVQKIFEEAMQAAKLQADQMLQQVRPVSCYSVLHRFVSVTPCKTTALPVVWVSPLLAPS